MSISRSSLRRLFSLSALLSAPLLFVTACDVTVEIGNDGPCLSDADCANGEVCGSDGTCLPTGCQPAAPCLK